MGRGRNNVYVVLSSRRKSGSRIFMRSYYVYILASKRNGALYIGVTSDLKKRVHQHKNNLINGFTKKYRVHHLAYFETTNNIRSAIQREKQMKEWKREWKIRLVQQVNPEWNDLYDTL